MCENASTITPIDFLFMNQIKNKLILLKKKKN